MVGDPQCGCHRLPPGRLRRTTRGEGEADCDGVGHKEPKAEAESDGRDGGVCRFMSFLYATKQMPEHACWMCSNAHCKAKAKKIRRCT
jgi:hypothetical protein